MSGRVDYDDLYDYGTYVLADLVNCQKKNYRKGVCKTCELKTFCIDFLRDGYLECKKLSKF